MGLLREKGPGETCGSSGFSVKLVELHGGSFSCLKSTVKKKITQALTQDKYSGVVGARLSVVFVPVLLCSI